MTSIKQDSTHTNSTAQSLSECVEKALRNYFDDLEGEDTSDLYDLVISQVENRCLKSY